MTKKMLFIMAAVAIILGCTHDIIQNDMFDNFVEKDLDVVSLSSLIGVDLYKTDYNIDLITKRTKSKNLKTKKLILKNSVTIFSEPFKILGEGNSTLIGKFKLFVELGFVSDYYFGPIATQTAANGDKLISYLSSEEFNEETGMTTLYWTYYEGTGRFNSLDCGELTLYGKIQPVENKEYDATGVFEGKGFITY